MRVLVTGASGFIGCHLTNKLAREKWIRELIVATGSKPLPKYPEVSTKIKYVQFNITNESVYKHIGEFDIIYHFAANPLVKHDSDNPNSSIRDNIIGTNNLLNFAAKRDSRFIFASSILVYGNSNFAFHVGDICNPSSIYGVTKLASEHLVNTYKHYKGVIGKNIRMCATCGPGVTHGIIHDFVRKLKSDSEYLEVFGDEPGAIKPFSYIDDVIDYIIDCSKTSHSITANICPRDNMSVKEIAETAMEVTGIKKPIKWLGQKSVWPGDNKFLLAEPDITYSPKYKTSKEAVEKAIYENLVLYNSN